MVDQLDTLERENNNNAGSRFTISGEDEDEVDSMMERDQHKFKLARQKLRKQYGISGKNLKAIEEIDADHFPKIVPKIVTPNFVTPAGAPFSINGAIGTEKMPHRIEKFTAVGVPGSMTFDDITGTIQGNPQTPGVYELRLSARDDHGQTLHLKPFVIVVSNTDGSMPEDPNYVINAPAGSGPVVAAHSESGEEESDDESMDQGADVEGEEPDPIALLRKRRQVVSLPKQDILPLPYQNHERKQLV